jgi:ABC-type Na+ efflux pump permease subunit
VVAATLVWLVLGYAFYSWLYAAAGSLAERQDQVQSLALPLAAPLIFGYIASLAGVSSGHASLLVKVLAYLPPTAPFAMPTLVGFGEATWWRPASTARPCSEPADGCGCGSCFRRWPSESSRPRQLRWPRLRRP